MEERLSGRRGQYKKTFEEPRRWREDVMTQIRKETRIEALNKKRHGLMGMTENPLNGEEPSKPKVLTRAQIFEAVEIMRSGNYQESYKATEDLRKVLSLEDGPPITEVIEAGAVPILMNLLSNDQDPKLQFEAAWCITNIASGNHEQTQVVIDHGAIPVFCELLKSDVVELREQAVWAIGNLSGDNVDARDTILELGAMYEIKKFIQVENSQFGNKKKIPFLVNCTWTISNLLRGKPIPSAKITGLAVTLLHKLIYLNDPDIQADACWAVSYLTDGGKVANMPVDNELPQRINDVLFVGLGFRLCELLVSPYSNVQIPALRSVGNIVTGSDDQTQHMILCGVVQNLSKLINHVNTTVQKEAVWAVSNITAGNRTQIQEVITQGIIPLLIDRLKNGDSEVRKEAAWAISNAVSGGNSQQVATIVKAGCLKPLCDAMVYHDERNTSVILDAIAAILKQGLEDQRHMHLDENPYEPALEQAGGFDRLEHLTGLNSRSKVRERAIEIIHLYLSEDNDNEDRAENNEGYSSWRFD